MTIFLIKTYIFRRVSLEQLLSMLTVMFNQPENLFVNSSNQNWFFVPKNMSFKGIAVKTSLDNSSTVQYSSLVCGLAKQVKSNTLVIFSLFWSSILVESKIENINQVFFSSEKRVVNYFEDRKLLIQTPSVKGWQN